MSELTPKESAQFAEGIYAVQDDLTFKAFLLDRKFSQDSAGQQKLDAKVGGRLLLNATDGFGLCALGGDRYAGDAFFIFRGTTTANNKADFLSDARIGTQMSKTGTAVHIGFNEIFKSMLPDIRRFIDSNRTKITGTVHCVGHSLGGAVATLAADWISSKTGLKVKLYSYGQPRAGMTMFSVKLTKKLDASNVHRVFHSTDPVPMVPIFPYVHSPAPGNGHLIPSSNLVVSGEAHKMASYIRSVRKKQWADLKRAAPVFNHEKAIEEFLVSKIRPDANNPLTWEWLDRALIYVLKKIGNGIFVGLHTAIVGVHTLADRIAWVLAKGIELTTRVGKLVRLFIDKVMQVLRMVPLKSGQTITQTFLTHLLTMLMNRAHETARRAIRGG